ncbi:MAG: B12-binding domain-containing protein [Nitrospirae bacterium]|nr:B12-binding domain-containing protein [Nitrospirota bacterium]
MDCEALKEAVISGKFREIQALVRAALDRGASAQDILDNALVPAMEEVGRRFSASEIFLPEMMVSAKMMQMALDVLKPILSSGHVKTRGKFAIGTIKDDLHDIGKDIVISMMQGAGFEVEDLGVDCPPERFIEAIERGNRIIGISAILTTVLPNIGKAIKAIEEKGLRDKVKILIGGVATSFHIAKETGADSYCKDAVEGVLKTKEFSVLYEDN